MSDGHLFDFSRDGGAMFSQCMTYRYTLTRWWRDAPKLVLVMLNPSTADAFDNDPTTRRCVKWAREHGFGSYEAVNLFAFRSASPAVMRAHAEPVGPDNDAHIMRAANSAATLVAAWGCHGWYRHRARDVLDNLQAHGHVLQCFGWTKNGQPRHPLMLPNPWVLEPLTNRWAS